MSTLLDARGKPCLNLATGSLQEAHFICEVVAVTSFHGTFVLHSYRQVRLRAFSANVELHWLNDDQANVFLARGKHEQFAKIHDVDRRPEHNQRPARPASTSREVERFHETSLQACGVLRASDSCFEETTSMFNCTGRSRTESPCWNRPLQLIPVQRAPRPISSPASIVETTCAHEDVAHSESFDHRGGFI